MAPRNNDANTSYKKKNFPEEDVDADVKNIVPCLLHKKHKVVKLVKCQMQKIQEEGLICSISGTNYPEDGNENDEPGTSRAGRYRRGEEIDMNSSQASCNSISLCLYFLMYLILLFLLILLIVWISAGPLSNSIAHTPIPLGSFIRTEGLCSLEKKYLLRWSKPEYFE